MEEQTFDWEVVAQTYSHKMKQLDYFHEIWEFVDFPTEEEISEMKRLQTHRDASS